MEQQQQQQVEEEEEEGGGLANWELIRAGLWGICALSAQVHVKLQIDKWK